MNLKLAGWFCLSLAFSTGAQAEDALPLQESLLSFNGDIGLLNLRSNELVYTGRTRISQLVWKSEGVQIFTGTLSISLPQEWRLSATAGVGSGGNSHMVDYDWVAAFASGRSHDQWTDRSIHPDTRLNHFFTVGAELGRNLWINDKTVAGMGLGFKYTDVKWSAWGGSYLYSQGDFRDERGVFPEDEKGISFRQKLPVPYFGVNLAHTYQNWSIEGAFQGGLAVNASSIDNHWTRKLAFDDAYDVTPTLSINATATYSLHEKLSLYVGGGLESMMRTKGDTTITSGNGPGSQTIKNASGGDYQSMMLSFGIKGRF